MRVLLGTHLVLWAMQGAERLSAGARAEIRSASTVYVSAVSLWEIAIKVRLGKLEVDVERFITCLREAGFEPLPVRWEHAAAIGVLPPVHHDPFDRVLVAQAMTEDLVRVV